MRSFTHHDWNVEEVLLRTVSHLSNPDYKVLLNGLTALDFIQTGVDDDSHVIAKSIAAPIILRHLTDHSASRLS
ncbi:hypothetical protein, partial [Rhodopirellula sallentina]|uniref:hypothetical protein n=1 Tax=Rhodopirellula sallentina TaxID=1263869 RepID=UPI001F47D0A3